MRVFDNVYLAHSCRPRACRPHKATPRPLIMSEAKVPTGSGSPMSACSQCGETIPRVATRRTRHAIPCGHVLCGACVSRAADEEKKLGASSCRARSCGQVFAPVSEFAVAWCTQRAERVASQLAVLMADQGNAGDHDSDSRETETSAADPWTLCIHHNEGLVGAASRTGRPLCPSCIYSVPPGVRTVEELSNAPANCVARGETGSILKSAKAALGGVKTSMQEYRETVEQWVSQETARVKVWEEREVDRIRAAAKDCCNMIAEAGARRLEAGVSTLAQRCSLQATFEEIDHELCDLPANETARASKRLLLVYERDRLAEQISSVRIRVPTASAVASSLALPELSRYFHDEEQVAPARATDAPQSSAAASAAEATSTLTPAMTLAEATRFLTQLRDRRSAAQWCDEQLPATPNTVCRIIRVPFSS